MSQEKYVLNMAGEHTFTEPHHDDAHLHHLTTISIKYQLPMVSRIMPGQYFKDQGHHDKVKGQIKATSSHCTHTVTKQCPYQVSYTLWFVRYIPHKTFKIKVTTTRSKVKSRIHQDTAHLHLQINVLTKYHLPTSYGLEDIAQTRF